MKAKVQKWGNSLAIRIPKAFAEETQMTQDSVVEVSLFDGGLKVTPIQTAGWRLEELLNAVTEQNIHPEAETGPAVGREVW